MAEGVNIYLKKKKEKEKRLEQRLVNLEILEERRVYILHKYSNNP